MRVLALLILSFFTTISFANPLQTNTLVTKAGKTEISKKKAVTLAKQTTDGKTLKITERINFYTVRILKTDGHVVDLKINKKTGEVKKD
ncbi:PepSY domain-containing protein [Pseudoalteromonas sp.]|uniref:PepSY domain-containing protein n=1 Tax=Pseudoalteromonas sp. TaxID=53249 RepID=UPI003564CC6F